MKVEGDDRYFYIELLLVHIASPNASKDAKVHPGVYVSEYQH